MSLLEEMAKAIHEEDNRATAYPIYVVQQLKRTYGVDPEHAKRFVWINEEGIEYDDEESPSHTSDFIRVGIEDEYVFVQPFFTEAGANKYIEENRHNLKHPRVYVESGYRNKEWQEIRKYLATLFHRIQRGSEPLEPKVRESLVAALGIPAEFLRGGLEAHDQRLLDDLKRLWANACTVARSYCPVPNVGDDHITQGIPLLAKRAADAEAERDKLRAQIEAYKDDCRDVMPIHWAFAEYDNIKPLRKVLNEESLKEWRQKIDMKTVEELSIASIIKANAELKKRVEVLEMAVEYLNEGKK